MKQKIEHVKLEKRTPNLKIRFEDPLSKRTPNLKIRFEDPLSKRTPKLILRFEDPLSNKNTSPSESVKKIKNGLIFVFSLCAASLFIFFLSNENKTVNKTENSAIVSVFKETYLNELLDLKNSENDEGSV